MSVLSIKNLSFNYPNNYILKDINIHVDKGEIVSILGGSGVGKTTLFNVIAGINNLQTGEITIQGDKNFKGKVSYMLQKDLLLEHKTVIQNIILPLLIKKVGKKEAELFLLDEPFSVLDAITKISLHSWYLEISKKLELTTLLITHDIDEAIELSDRIYIIKNKPGEIVSEIKIVLDNENIEENKLKYKKEILNILGL